MRAWIVSNALMLVGVVLGVGLAAYGLAKGGPEASGWIVAGATVVYAVFTYRIASLNQQAVAATWQLVTETQTDRYLTRSPRLTLWGPYLSPFQGGLVISLRNIATVAAEEVRCDVWGMVSAGGISNSQPSPSRRYYSIPQGFCIGPTETSSMLLFSAEEGTLGDIQLDLARAEQALAAFHQERGFRPTPGTFICQTTWQDALSAGYSRQFQLFLGAPLPDPGAAAEAAAA